MPQGTPGGASQVGEGQSSSLCVVPHPPRSAPLGPLPVPALHPHCLGRGVCIAFLSAFTSSLTPPASWHTWGLGPQAVSFLGAGPQ